MNTLNPNILFQFIEKNEVNGPHMTINDEFDFYNLVSNGNREGLDKRGFSLLDKGLGKLSDNSVKNVQYHFIISISLITRKCIEKGMAPEAAYTLSDIYIQEVDRLSSVESINTLHKTMVYDYTEKMKKISKNNHYSKNITKAINYINEHIDSYISTDDVANAIGLSKAYLCTLFKKEIGMTIGSYIEEIKNDLAIEYLTKTDISYIDISNALGYTSYSYFIQKFKRANGMPPSTYRERNNMKYLA